MFKWAGFMLGFILAMVVGFAKPAFAANGYLGLYDNSNGTVLLEETVASAYIKNVCYAVTGYSDNRTSYIKNNTNSQFYVYTNSTCSSTPGTIYANSVGPMTGVWNNSISSLYRAT